MKHGFAMRPHGYRGEYSTRRVLTGECASWQNVIGLPRNALEQFFTPSMPALMEEVVDDGKTAIVKEDPSQ